MVFDEIKNLIENNTRRWDVFKTLLGIFFLFSAIYLWITYFIHFDGSLFNLLQKHELGLYLLFWLIPILTTLGFYFFITGITEMENNYDVEKVLIQLHYIKALQELSKVKLDQFKLDKKSNKKFKDNLKKRIKQLINSFE